MTDFRNSYHFVPRQPPLSADQRRHTDDQLAFGLTPATVADGHAVYAPGTSSGRLTCRVTLECPVVIGAARTSGEGHQRPSIVAPFLFQGRPAIPATSLKGVISSIAESASRAPYRVLEDMKLTVAYGNYPLWTRNSKGDSTPGTQIGTTYNYVAAERRPMTVTRSQVNPVEAMFGYVHDNGTTDTAIKAGKLAAVAGKLRFSHAMPSGDWAAKGAAEFFMPGDYAHPVPGTAALVPMTRLKEQGQPMKQPKNHTGLRSATPNFYFSTVGAPGAFISKQDFGTKPAATYEPQGGKFYLHHSNATSEPWKTADTRSRHADLERKAEVAVVKAGITFDFQIDFDNLTDRELNLLCYALRPSPRFRHKIGLGKGLGLGSIRIDIAALALVDRTARYAASGVFADDPRATAIPGQTGLATVASGINAHDTWLTSNDRSARQALLAIGETHNFDDAGGADAQVPVLSVPLTTAKMAAGGIDAEKDSFEWFAINDRANVPQRLTPISGNIIPKLRTNGPAGGGSGRAAVPIAPPVTPLPRRGPIAGAERQGNLRFCATNKKTSGLYGFIIQIDPLEDYYLSHELCLKAGLKPGVKRGVLVAYEVGPNGQVTAVRLI